MRERAGGDEDGQEQGTVSADLVGHTLEGHPFFGEGRVGAVGLATFNGVGSLTAQDTLARSGTHVYRSQNLCFDEAGCASWPQAVVFSACSISGNLSFQDVEVNKDENG